MNSDRSAVIHIGDEEYPLLLTTKATREIAARYGGLENLGEKLMKSENFEMALAEIVWLIALLANQPILIHNLRHKDEQKPVLTEDEIELLTVPIQPRTHPRGDCQSDRRASMPSPSPSAKLRGCSLG